MKIDKKKIVFVILAGGRSKRFGGGFKTFSEINGKSIFNRILEKLEKHKIEIIINANHQHKQFTKSKLPIVKDELKGFLGPLAGIYSSIKWSKREYPSKEWIFTVPSDTPFLPENILEIFCTNLKLGDEILIARSNNKIHPVISMWNVSLQNSLEIELKNNNRKIMNWVEKHKYSFVDFEIKNLDPFFNINTKDDLNLAENFDHLNP